MRGDVKTFWTNKYALDNPDKMEVDYTPLFCFDLKETLSMYAIIRVGGRQYRVEENSTLLVNKLEGSAGTALTIDEVLAIGGENPIFGAPIAENAKVTATIVEQTKGVKIDGYTYKAKKNVRHHYGHRQQLTKLHIDSIAVGK